jgi:F-type H+-transporting ATPase subunit b
MDSLVSSFHIDIKLLLAQVINFAIVFAVLYFFVLKPLTKVMKDRTDKIEKSLNEAKEIETKLAQTEDDYMKEITKAKKEAGVILEQAKKTAEENKNATIARAKEEVGQIINQEKQKIQTEKAETLREIKKDVANLVEAALVKLIEEKLNDKKDMEIIRKTLKG